MRSQSSGQCCWHRHEVSHVDSTVAPDDRRDPRHYWHALQRAGRPAETTRPHPLAVFSFLTGLLSILLIIASVLAPAAPADVLAFFTRNRGLYILPAIIVLTWAAASIPFVVSLSALFRGKGPNLALAAAFLSAGGILLLGFGVSTFIGVPGQYALHATQGRDSDRQ
jgi:hypothetical protein